MSLSTNNMSLKQKLFCRKLIELTGNQTDAYLAIYNEDYKLNNGKEMTRGIATRQASRMLLDVDVYSYYEKLKKELLAAADVSAESILSRFEAWASFDPRSVFEWKKIEVFQANGSSFSPPRYRMSLFAKSMEDIPDEAWSCIESVEEGRDGFKIKVIDRLKANIELAKFLGMDKKVVENTSNLIMSFDKQDMNL